LFLRKRKKLKTDKTEHSLAQKPSHPNKLERKASQPQRTQNLGCGASLESMRIITWNCRGAFLRKHASIAALHPDVLIIPECGELSGLTQVLGCPPVRTYKWFGDNPSKGLGVISYGDYELKVHEAYEGRHRWVVPLKVSGPRSFLLFAVWTLPDQRSRSYVQPLIEALHDYEALLDSGEAIWAGDFNSNFVFDRPSRRHKFADFVGLLAKQEIHSIYHRTNGCGHGDEADKTFYHYHHHDKGHHIDYIFASKSLHQHGCEVAVGTYADWAQSSDHVPLICTIRGVQCEGEPKTLAERTSVTDSD
jgi:hypothetical protein